MNNSDFGYDCRNNIDNCQVQEITHLKRYYNYFNSEVSKFVSSDLIRKEIEATTLIKKLKDKRKKEHYIIVWEHKKKHIKINSKIKSLIDFDKEYVSSIKSLAIKKETKINLTTRFLNGKMLMFCKTSIQSFVYDLIDIFMFSDETVKKIYDKYDVIKFFIDIDSTSMFFVFICKLS